VTPLSTVTDLGIEEKENIPQAQSTQATPTPQKQAKKSKGMGMSRNIVAEGFRNLFR
jgi:hypothetical protein